MSFLTKLPRDQYVLNAFDRFSASQEAFDLGIARALAWACQLAYETDETEKVTSLAAGWGLEVCPGGILSKEIVTVLPKASTQVIVLDHGDAFIITFAGTDPLVLADWISNFDIGVTATGVANGFAVAAAAVTDQIAEILSTSEANKPIFVAGHSLGGALAVLCAKKINVTNFGRVRAVYTFGMPRPGNAEFATAYDQLLGMRTYRLVHGHDVVPTVAPSFFGFRHVGRYLHCGRAAKFDARSMAVLVGSDDPPFLQGISKELKGLLHGSFSGVLSIAERLKIIAALAVGGSLSGMRSDPGGLMIELLPPPLRDHMPDRYIRAIS
ncbi:lipase family protein [Bradyrhizobium yuanmingense]|uniref:lipase family protein n=1 Tax=Bradyrhizobium yuanmingense TaxID=108015 RepID=UPI0021A800AF|nr:lipase family protein [Bradyrhizobium sp. CB1024]UWU83193.1 lipase family protein [Bradyrhizobium sp. CB1024]